MMKHLLPFNKLPNDIKDSCVEIRGPLNQGLAILAIGLNYLSLEYLSSEEISEALENIGISTDPISITRAFARAGKKIKQKTINGIKKYKIMSLGLSEIENSLSVKGPKVYHFDSGKSFTNRLKIEDIFNCIQGDILILDPYYGSRTFSLLPYFNKAHSIKLLTCHSSEKQNTLISLYKDYQKELSNLQIRIYPNASSIHDRYLISSNYLFLLGHGLKDIGSKESFLIQLNKSDFQDLHSSLTDIFNSRWTQSTPL